MPDQIDSKWIEKITRGDEAAFKKLFLMYCQLLINFARRFVKDTQIAENIVQDVFLNIWKNRSQLDPSANLKIYLYVAVKNQSYKYLRHLQVKHDTFENIKLEWSSLDTAEYKIEEKETLSAINNTIEKLPEKAQAVFKMNRFDNLSYKEIATILNISVKTVETHMGRSLKFLRDKLKHLLIFIHL